VAPDVFADATLLIVHSFEGLEQIPVRQVCEIQSIFLAEPWRMVYESANVEHKQALR
jgi:hypothetical protein